MANSQEVTPEFGKLRSFFWPIHRFELKKLLPMLLIFFLITLNYNILRTMKDTLVVTSDFAGAEVIPFIKVWFMFPGSVLMAFIFTRLLNRFPREYVFYIIVLIFVSFFTLFAFVLYPYRDYLHPHQLCDQLQSILPSGCKGLVAAFRNWSFTLFYVMAEVWGNIVLALLMWGFVNQVTKLGEATRFYAIFGVGINSSGIVAGFLSLELSRITYNPLIPYGTTAWEQSMLFLLSIVIISSFASMLLFRWLNTKVLTEPAFQDTNEFLNKSQSVRGRISMRDSIRYLFKSRYLTCLALIVITYNVVINLVEVVWKHEVNQLYPDKQAYHQYMSCITMVMGVAATFMSMFVAGNAVRKLGWSFTAMLTPLILLFTSILFFGAIFAEQYFSDLLLALTGISPLFIVVTLGSLQNVLSRSAKYTVFDETREMALIPLSPDCKLKGKAVIDGVCSRMGKSTGSFVYQSLLITFSSLASTMPYVATLLFCVIGIWLGVTWMLGKEFNALANTNSDSKSKSEEEEVHVIQEQLA